MIEDLERLLWPPPPPAPPDMTFLLLLILVAAVAFALGYIVAKRIE